MAAQTPQRTIYAGTLIDTPFSNDLRIRHNAIMGVDTDGTIAFINTIHDPPPTSPDATLDADSHLYIADFLIHYAGKICMGQGWDPQTTRIVSIGPAATRPSDGQASPGTDERLAKRARTSADTSTSTSTHETTNSRTNPTPKQKTTRYLFPGLHDTHTHAPQYPNTGIFGSSTLLDWLDTYTFPLESSFDSLPLAKRVYERVVARTLSHGTTSAAYYGTLHVPATKLLAEVCGRRGQRALVGRVCMDTLSPEGYRDESVADAISATEECLSHCEKLDPSGQMVRGCITPRFAVSCSSESLTALGKLAEETGAAVQTHVSENHAEIEEVKRLFPDSRNYVDVYDKHGLLGPKTVLAHAVHLSQEEVRLIRESGSGVSHCPASNTCLTSGAARVKHFMNSGVNVGLGTDMSGGYSPSVLAMVRQSLMVSRHVAMGLLEGKEKEEAKLSVSEGLYLATVGGAKIVGLEGVVGKFEVGMQFDAMMVCLEHVADVKEDGEVDGEANGAVNGEVDDIDLEGIGPVDVFGWEKWEDRVAKWVYCGDDRNVAAVWVKGRLVHKTSKYRP